MDDLFTDAARQVLADQSTPAVARAIEAGGSTLRDYAHTDGSLGYFQHRFKVYDREGEPCRQCGTIVRRIVQAYEEGGTGQPGSGRTHG